VELLKLRKRLATWVLALVWAVVVVLFGYLLTYSFVANPPEPAEDVPPDAQAQEQAINEAQLEALLPENLLENLFGSGIFGVGAAVVLILGALTAGAASRFVVARLEEAAVAWPSLGEALRGVGIGSLVFAVWGTFGFGLAVLFRGTPLAIGLGLAWALAVENTIAALPIESDAFESFRRFTLGENTSGATSYFGSPFPEEFGVPKPLVEPERAAITLLLYVAAFVVLAALFFWRRDVT
jgi:ABC-2 type transport system permease protein